MFSFWNITLPFHRQKSQTNSYKKDGVSKLKQCGLNQRSPARSGKAKPKLRLAQGSALPFIHIFDNSQHLTFAEEIVKSCFESC
ncbi:hypothetical protein, partial [Prevotella sp.]|uniref:hypothetical protein n=1 Tax=Prevotella sp. TaxID=59823 RepID=UPI0027E370A4